MQTSFHIYVFVLSKYKDKKFIDSLISHVHIGPPYRPLYLLAYLLYSQLFRRVKVIDWDGDLYPWIGRGGFYKYFSSENLLFFLFSLFLFF